MLEIRNVSVRKQKIENMRMNTSDSIMSTIYIYSHCFIKHVYRITAIHTKQNLTSITNFLFYMLKIKYIQIIFNASHSTRILLFTKITHTQMKKKNVLHEIECVEIVYMHFVHQPWLK